MNYKKTLLLGGLTFVASVSFAEPKTNNNLFSKLRQELYCIRLHNNLMNAMFECIKSPKDKSCQSIHEYLKSNSSVQKAVIPEMQKTLKKKSTELYNKYCPKMDKKEYKARFNSAFNEAVLHFEDSESSFLNKFEEKAIAISAQIMLKIGNFF